MNALNTDAIVKWILACADAIARNRDALTDLDAAIGDADHGANMDRGFKAVAAKLPSLADKDIATVLKTTGMTLISTVGGASGALYGTFFLQAAQECAGKVELDARGWLAAFEAGVAGIANRGKAVAGDKTMIDALAPALSALRETVESNAPLDLALVRMAAAAKQGAEATVPLVARKGRASYLGERSAGHQDPGATSTTLILEAAAKAWSA